jgi:xanthine dehydrogenase accessory factor
MIEMENNQPQQLQPVLRILVRGSGDIGSVVAHRLFQAGYAVVIHDIPHPTSANHKLAFTDAFFAGHATLDGVYAQRIKKRSLLRGMLAAHEILPVTTINITILLHAIRPQVLVDARMKKHCQPESQIRLAPLTIGLGPNFIAGKTVHLAVETDWGGSLGQVIVHSATKPLMGESKSIQGHTCDRYLYVPTASSFLTPHEIGDAAAQGKEIACIGEAALHAPISSDLRELTRDDVPVKFKTKIIGIGPRTDNPKISGIAGRPTRIAQGVLQVVQDWEQNQVH